MRYLRILATLSLAFLTGCKAIVDKLVDIAVPCIAFPLLVLTGGCLSIVLLAGCKIKTLNQGEAGVRWGTEVTFFSRSAKTADEPATIESDAPALVDWLVKPKPDPVPVTPAEPTP